MTRFPSGPKCRGRQLDSKCGRPTNKGRKAAEALGVKANEGQSQSRGQETEDAEKYRIIVELRQVILDYFKPGVAP